MRLLLAAVYVTMGVSYPLPFGAVPAIFGVAFGVLACVAARTETLRACLSLRVRSSDGARSADIEVLGAASARFAARYAAEALGLPLERASYPLERAGVPLDPRRGLAAAGVRSSEVLTLVPFDRHMNVPSCVEAPCGPCPDTIPRERGEQSVTSDSPSRSVKPLASRRATAG
jgi:hypothetical protein